MHLLICEDIIFSYICGDPLYTFSDDCNNGATTYLFLGGVVILVANFMALLLVGSKKIAEMVLKCSFLMVLKKIFRMAKLRVEKSVACTSWPQ